MSPRIWPEKSTDGNVAAPPRPDFHVLTNLLTGN
jgi:hypothetical protein